MFERSGQTNVRRRRTNQKYEDSDSTNCQRHTQKNGKAQRKRPKDPKQRLAVMIMSLAGMGVWYMTPVSEWLTTLLLYQIPIEADVALGKASMVDFPYPTTYHPYWTPLVQEVGYELISTLDKSSSGVLEEAGRGYQANLVEEILDFIDIDATTNFGVSQNKKRSSGPYQLRNYQWDFGVVKAPIVNAFALPGGVIRVTDELLEQLQPTRGELASLLGHEIAHCFFRHSQKRIVQQKMFQLVVNALTYEDDDEEEETFGQAMGELLLKSATWFGQQRFSRQDEYQADATSWALLLESTSYNPQSMRSVLDKLFSLQGRTPTTLEWMSTHPGTEARMEVLQDKWLQLSRQERKRLHYRSL